MKMGKTLSTYKQLSSYHLVLKKKKFIPSMIENSKRNHTFLLHASWLMHTSILDGAVCTTITHPNLLLSQGRTQ